MGAKPKHRFQGLAGRKARFVAEYLVDMNGAQAAIRAGYSPRRARERAYKLLHEPKVRQAIDAALKAASERLALTAEEVLHELKIVGLANLADYEVGPDGRLRVRDGLPQERLRAVAAVKRRVKRVITEEGPTEIEVSEVKLHNKLEALRLAGLHLRLFSEQQEEGSQKVFLLPVPALTAEDWQRQVAQRKALASGTPQLPAAGQGGDGLGAEEVQSDQYQSPPPAEGA